VMRWGSDAIKKTYLTRLASNTIGAYCLSEAGFQKHEKGRWPSAVLLRKTLMLSSTPRACASRLRARFSC